MSHCDVVCPLRSQHAPSTVTAVSPMRSPRASSSLPRPLVAIHPTTMTRPMPDVKDTSRSQAVRPSAAA